MFSVVVQGQGVRWVCGTSGVNKLYYYRETYSAPFSPLWRVYVKWINNSWWEHFKKKKKKAASLYFKKSPIFFTQKAGWPSALYYLYLVSHIVIKMMATAMIIILCCNKPIRRAFSAVYSTAKTPDGHTVFSGRLVNCIFPPAKKKAMSDKWSEVQSTEEQWVCYHSAVGRRTANCNKP